MTSPRYLLIFKVLQKVSYSSRNSSDEKAQAVVQDLTTSQLDDAEGYRLKAMELMKQNGALSILASMSKSKALNLFTPEQKYSYNMFEEAMNYKNFVIKRRDSKYISSALKEARPMLLKAPEDLDANADDLNTPTAIYHLPDGIAGARPHEASDLMTKVTAVSPDNNGNEIWCRETFYLMPLFAEFCK